ncbi:hypothetical protein E0W68_01005 [Flavobacterium salilacus subsp. salilacus]|uniref:hypothetical protein n=1 Tax=Flavobacterium TaxID=237 RepID=UPI001074D947|nr:MULTISPECIES: hypothetical protein [Flavobacterium]KAF2519841.1 hypothetical protein E0W68_01005 [Flavobacterium salilacus subsp. salilacus]MBE1614260.1 hypothetical protein [Flavobacterium sp. SaA2.13]
MRKIIVLLSFLLTFSAFSQNKDISDYKYLIVPERFEFQKKSGEYNLNELTKMLFEKYGFTVFYAKDKMPDELAFDRCKALYADITEDSSMFKTGLTITINDCWGKTLFTSIKGESKEKALKNAYYEALREASRSLDTMQYDYNENAKPTTSVTKPKEPTVRFVEAKTDSGNDASTLFAQPITNGYQLVDSAPKVVLKIYKTSQPDSYIATAEGKNGIVLKDDGNWFFQYYQKEELVIEKLNIKF